nr:DNA mismatch repair protein MutS [uncultured Stomatobaculum sp.]
MMTHYLETKKAYPDCLLFYRLGDFYEMFFEDARLASKELELTLTGKECGLEERAPMCGVPFHAADSYINRLVKRGYKVAVAEQMEDPKLAKGLVKREVIRVVTPGTVTAAGALEEEKNNYLAAVSEENGRYGLAFADISTGSFFVTEADGRKELGDILAEFRPAELLKRKNLSLDGCLRHEEELAISELPDSAFLRDNAVSLLTEHFRAATTEALGLSDYPLGTLAAGAALRYLYDTQKNSCELITELKAYRGNAYLFIDAASRRNLELTETLRDKNKHGSLLWVLDRTKTAMGARFLRNLLEKPLLGIPEIEARQDAIQEFLSRYIDREELREYLAPIYDMERLMGRITLGSANARDMLAFGSSIAALPPIKDLLQSFSAPLLRSFSQSLDDLRDLSALLARAIADDPPLTLREGHIIKDGYHEDVDRYRRASTEGKQWLAELEERERNRTGIKNLRIKYNKVFGYYFEVTKSALSQVPDYFQRRQTLANAERYTTEELGKLEESILGAEEKLLTLEFDLFQEVRQKLSAEVARIQTSAGIIAYLDALLSLADVAERYQYVRPKLTADGPLRIVGGRHPVVERMMESGRFVENDTLLDSEENRIAVITGPNMAGKSTYMRQTALIALLAQTGSFVPATEAEIGISDRIFTRVGASDDLASGQSTFMVEMTEVANILRNATKRSLIILDEIGRGTSTFDGLSIAWAVVEYLATGRLAGAKTLFATHYHELTELEGSIPGVHNYCIAVKEQGDTIAFLRKIVKGGADQSYGIQVAKLAGVPETVTARAREIAAELSGADIAARAKELAARGQAAAAFPAEHAPCEAPLQPAERDILERLKKADLSELTPRAAIDFLYQLQEAL